jgi:outer membrane protein assembly factor BamB
MFTSLARLVLLSVAFSYCHDATCCAQESAVAAPDRDALRSYPLKWKQPIGSNAGPIVALDDRVLLGTIPTESMEPPFRDMGVLVCFEAATGRVLWKRSHEKLKHRANDLPMLGIQSKPAVEGTVFYYVSNRGELTCSDLDGQTKWLLDMPRHLDVFKRDAWDIGNPICSPLAVGDLVFCITGNGTTFGYTRAFDGAWLPKPDAPSFIAVQKTTGHVIWTSNAPSTEIFYGQWSSPVAVETRAGQLVVFPAGDGRLYAFEAVSGQLKWLLDCNLPDATKWSFNHRGTRCSFVGPPVVKENILYAGLNQDYETPDDVKCPIIAVDLDCGQKGNAAIIWRTSPAGFAGTLGSVAVGGDLVFALDRAGLLVALDARLGSEVWRHKVGDNCSFLGEPRVFANRLFVPSNDEIVELVISRRVKVVDRIQLGASIVGSPVIHNGTMYVATKGELWALEHSTDASATR